MGKREYRISSDTLRFPSVYHYLTSVAGSSLPVAFIDEELDSILTRPASSEMSWSRHFSQGEEFFIRFAAPYEVPSFAIHHDIRTTTPSQGYRRALHAVVRELQGRAPWIFSGLRYSFDPSDVLRPVFYQLFRTGEASYLYQLRIDLVFRPQIHHVVSPGTNDTTPVYRTRELFLEGQLIPLQSATTLNKGIGNLAIDQMISDTWIGETGRGYFVQGIWIDNDLNKFFSKLMVTPGKRIYPYYPFTSRYRTVCHTLISLDGENRRAAVPRLHHFRRLIAPRLEEVEQVLREEEFRDDLPLFRELRETIPREWRDFLEPVGMQVYLNEQDMKEFEVTTHG